MKGQNGITLIALIITVIVLLILAGVAISALTGNNSLFNRVSNSASIYNNSVDTESKSVNNVTNLLVDQMTNMGY